MDEAEWKRSFRGLFEKGGVAYRQGKHFRSWYTSGEEAFLAEIGGSLQEIFDFVEDNLRMGEPDYETVEAITSLRRRYFLEVQGGKPGTHLVDMDALPAKREELDGIPWLPRIIEKAKAKLRGEMPPDLMYGCGGDRPFLREMNVELSEFLHLVWRCGNDNRKIIDYVKKRRSQLAA